jgi:hypothetical protein
MLVVRAQGKKFFQNFVIGKNIRPVSRLRKS